MHHPVTTLTFLPVIYYKVQCLSSRDPTGENPAFSLPISTAQVQTSGWIRHKEALRAKESEKMLQLGLGSQPKAATDLKPCLKS